MKSILLFLRYRLMTSARNVYIRFKAKLAMALFALAKAIAAPAEEAKADRILKTKTEVKADSVSVSNADSKKNLKNSLLAKAVAYLRAPISHVRNMFLKTKSEIGAAPGSSCKTDSEIFSFDLKANANSADGTPTDANRKLSTVSVFSPVQNPAEEIERKAVCKLDMSAELFHSFTVGAQSSDTEISVLKASPRYWIMPYVDENGILHIRQAYYAEMNGNILEVR